MNKTYSQDVFRWQQTSKQKSKVEIIAYCRKIQHAIVIEKWTLIIFIWCIKALTLFFFSSTSPLPFLSQLPFASQMSPIFHTLISVEKFSHLKANKNKAPPRASKKGEVVGGLGEGEGERDGRRRQSWRREKKSRTPPPKSLRERVRFPFVGFWEDPWILMMLVGSERAAGGAFPSLMHRLWAPKSWKLCLNCQLL